MIEISTEYWRLIATISATMIGLVFLGTFYYLESGWEVIEVFRAEMEEIMVGYAKIIISYFSVSLLLSLFQEDFVFSRVETAAFVFLAVTTAIVTKSLNQALKDVQIKLGIGFYYKLRFANWVLWNVVFLVPIGIYNVFYFGNWGVSALLLVPEIIFAWVVLIGLMVGYWNLIQFLLAPHQFHKYDREKKDRENKRAINQNEKPPNETWSEDRQSVAEEEIQSALNEISFNSTTDFEIEGTYLTGEQLSADLSEPKLRWAPTVSEVGEAMIHVVVPDKWYWDGDFLDRATNLAYKVSIITRDAYRDLTGVEVRIWRIHLLPGDETSTPELILKLRWRDYNMSALDESISNTNEILNSASDVLIDPCLFPLGLTEEDFDPSEREPEQDEDFSFYEIRDVSHAKAKRYDSMIIIQPGLTKSEIKELLPEIVEEVRQMEVYSNEIREEKWRGEMAHVVWLNVFSESRSPPEMVSNDSVDHFVCKAEWFDPELDPNYTPLEMTDYDDEYNGIRIKWSS